MQGNFSWSDVAWSSGFGAIGGGTGFILKDTKWDSGLRSVLLAVGQESVEGTVDVGRQFYSASTLIKPIYGPVKPAPEIEKPVLELFKPVWVR